MSNALAIAGVTAVLRDLLNEGLINGEIDAIGQFSVSSSPPDRLPPQQGAPAANQLNVFLWNVSRNPGWANERLPARGPAGVRTDSPYLALDLHYILTAVGTADLNAEILLGYGMQILHETPVLTREAIRTALAAGGPVDADMLPPARQFLVAADLADQFERLRITPAPMDADMISNLWPAFSAPLRVSALYEVSCVLIESRTPVRCALPVLTIGGRTATLRRPRIALIRPLPGGPGTLPETGGAVLPGGWIAIDGTALTDDLMRLRVGEREVAVDPGNAGNARVEVQLPGDLRAGLATVQIEHLWQPEAGGPRLWEASNPAAMLVTPVLGAVEVAGAVEGGRFDGTVTATLAHDVGADQTVALLFNSLPADPPEAFSVRARPRAADGTEVVADLTDAPAGTFLIRVEVGGAPSALTVDPDDGFTGPTVTLEDGP
jgi:hypothetical protein